MSRDQIIARAQRGGGYGASFSPWKSDFAAMCRKTVLKALLSGGTVPLSTEARQALAADGDSPEAQSEHPAGDVTQLNPTPGEKPGQSGTDKLKDAIGMNGGGNQVIDVPYEEAPPPGPSPFGGYQ
jgi:recombinational DNA repair protein RecT